MRYLLICLMFWLIERAKKKCGHRDPWDIEVS